MKLPSTQASRLKNQQTFTAFYEAYASKVWGIVLAANLPRLQSETILIHTFTEAWRQLDSPILEDNYVLAKLLKIAREEGLPIEVLQTILNPNRVQRPRGFFQA